LARCDRNGETIRGCIRKTMHAVRREIVILGLFTVRNHRRACGFKALDGVSNRSFIERSQVRIGTVAFCDSLDEISGPRNAANRLGGYGDWRRLSHARPPLARGPPPVTLSS